MRHLFILLALALSGCVSVYGPTKTGNQPGSAAETAAGESTAAAKPNLIGNRNPDELLTRTEAIFAQKGLEAKVVDPHLGIVGTTGNDAELASLYLTCSDQPGPSNLNVTYRILVQIFSAGEGTNVMVQVNGVAGLVAADGNDKVKPFECSSSGVFEKDLLQALRK
ncbi:hypothetical protein [Serratia fonticola]|uniref:hypothetical protein n=1 Tax=Serratia fonticola TaxID=47917 RepID=UPI0003AF1E43|nr:hypothetical protein [Serratia fonticola]ERK10731.1 hypothetical protein L581_4087 [Serratia fonticola AU-AP2C]MBP0998672.1 hypothetical protein [Serratia fonticola]MBP1003474.1 hypothetical protein [Serratia fonticola]MBP1010922.1 hypothetical protein [Serratia fonticola]